MSAKASAPGNIFLFGEHSVVYERPAIIAAIQTRTWILGETRTDGIVVAESQGYGTIKEPVSQIVHKLFQEPQDYTDPIMDPTRHLISEFHRQIHNLDQGVTMKITSDIPPRTGGLSSSTSFLVAALETLSRLFCPIEREKYFDILYPIQRLIHGGKASGAEIQSSTFGGYSRIRVDKSIAPPKWEREKLGELELSIVVGDTGIQAKTSETVPYVQRGFEAARDWYSKVFERIGRLAEEGMGHLLAGRLEEVGILMNENHELLARDLGISHPKLNAMVDAARTNGALGAKLSGGGKGGIMIALARRETEGQIIHALKDAGAATAFSAKVGGEGVHVNLEEMT